MSLNSPFHLCFKQIDKKTYSHFFCRVFVSKRVLTQSGLTLIRSFFKTRLQGQFLRFLSERIVLNIPGTRAGMPVAENGVFAISTQIWDSSPFLLDVLKRTKQFLAFWASLSHWPFSSDISVEVGKIFAPGFGAKGGRPELGVPPSEPFPASKADVGGLFFSSLKFHLELVLFLHTFGVWIAEIIFLLTIFDLMRKLQYFSQHLDTVDQFWIKNNPGIQRMQIISYSPHICFFTGA